MKKMFDGGSWQGHWTAATIENGEAAERFTVAAVDNGKAVVQQDSEAGTEQEQEVDAML
jgi:hypothetical protein